MGPTEEEILADAWWLLGYWCGLSRAQRKRYSRQLQRHVKEAQDIVTGGSFRGPIAIMDMRAAVVDLKRQWFLEECAHEWVE